MRARSTVLVCLLLVAGSAFAGERYVLISGTTAGGTFRTDARILNPSFTKDITISATLLELGNVNNSGATPVTVTVPKRQMLILNDVISGVFNRVALGAIRLVSEDEFEITTRIYAATASGTLGQFGPGLPLSAARAKGALLQLRSRGSGFRTNIGAVNPTSNTVSVKWTLYDRNNATIAGNTIQMPPYAVIGPTNMESSFFFNAGSADISDAWVSFATDGSPIYAYASVIDNTSTDQTFVPAVDDVGVAPPPSEGTTHTFDVTMEDFSITFSPAPRNINVGDQVILRIRRLEGSHGFQLSDPNFTPVVPATVPINETTAVERSFTVNVQGVYQYFCTNSACGAGHSQMFGSFTVGTETEPGGPPY